MLTVLAIMTAGIVTGYALRGMTALTAVINPVINVAICLLLFMIGISVGVNETITGNLDILGWQALILTLGAVTGSVVLSYFTWKIFFKKSS